jgi:hypothetical protein
VREEHEAGLALAQPCSRVGGRGNLTPRVAQVVDVCPVGLRDRRPALAEVPGRDDQHGVARRDEIRDRGLHRAAAGAPKEQHFLLGAEDLAQAREHARVELAVIRAAVVDHGLADRREHLGRRRRRPGRHQVALLRHDPEGSASGG